MDYRPVLWQPLPRLPELTEPTELTPAGRRSRHIPRADPQKGAYFPCCATACASLGVSQDYRRVRADTARGRLVLTVARSPLCPYLSLRQARPRTRGAAG